MTYQNSLQRIAKRHDWQPFVFTLVLLCLAASPAVAVPDIQWTQQWGTIFFDSGQAVAAGALNDVFVAGNIGTSPEDGYLRRYGAAGNLIWNRSLSTTAEDTATGVAADNLGNSYVVGTTSGALEGPSNGLHDIYISKYDSNGVVVWGHQYGMAQEEEFAFGTALDGIGGLYVAGHVATASSGQEAYLAKFSTNGALLWDRQFGTSGDDISRGTAADALGNVFVAGYVTERTANAQVGYVRKYNTDGTLQWDRQFPGGGYAEATSVATDGSGNAYVTGRTTGSVAGPNAGETDSFVSKYDANGNLLWSHQFGGSAADEAFGISVQANGDAFVTGLTGGAAFGISDLTKRDIFLTKFDAAGNQQWFVLDGTTQADRGLGISVDGSGYAYITGDTGGALAGTSAGNNDAFLVKYRVVPEPNAAALIGFATMIFGTQRSRRRSIDDMPMHTT